MSNETTTSKTLKQLARKVMSNETTAMKLIEVSKPAVACVILSSGFVNVGNFVFFAREEDAVRFAESEGGRVVDETGLAEEHEAMHCAEGRQPNQSYAGRFVETPEDADDDWQEQVWAEEYAKAAREDFEGATVYALKEEDEDERE